MQRQLLPIRRLLTAVFALLFCVGMLTAAHAHPTVILLGNPAPPSYVSVTVGTKVFDYTWRVTVQAETGQLAFGCNLSYSDDGGLTYYSLAAWDFSRTQASGTHTFTEEFLAAGTFYMQATGVQSGGPTNSSTTISQYGPYYAK